MVTNDIWKATGYRFTVKDHPPTERGHKTRLWCSQDEARRSKHRGNSDAPRMSKQGELFAKQRFPCRSRLMITCLPPGGEGSRGEGAGGRVVTIRMHHYMRHEAYLESAAEATNNGVEPVEPPPLMSFLGTINAPLPPVLMGMTMDMRGVGRGDIELPRAVPVAPPPPLHEQEGEWEMSHAHHDQQESPPEPAPPSPSPSPHFAPAPAPARLPIDPQLEGLAHHHRSTTTAIAFEFTAFPAPFSIPRIRNSPYPHIPHNSILPNTLRSIPHHRTSIPHHHTSILHRRSIPLSLRRSQRSSSILTRPSIRTHRPNTHRPNINTNILPRRYSSRRKSSSTACARTLHASVTLQMDSSTRCSSTTTACSRRSRAGRGAVYRLFAGLSEEEGGEVGLIEAYLLRGLLLD
ncbi:hypothetical protein MVEN_02454600 [Mycena venus]|uniref:Uncharacterized protein n=1 Tax=Mycena venus TaxID=2733690 RepID=A0A8H7CBI4_9AGAR|nr:hypothetical protein MVEN_02454600 [Mycena venus]